MSEAPAAAFNLAHQQADGWWRRAHVAVDLLDGLHEGRVRVADIGCGDRKLADVFAQRGLAIDYAGFDLLPQTPAVARFDLRRDRLPARVDVAVVLGVTEYLPDIAAALRGLQGACDWLLASHVVASPRSPSRARLAELGWVSHLGRRAFLTAVVEGGFAVERKRMTPDGRTLVVLARAVATADRQTPATGTSDAPCTD